MYTSSYCITVFSKYILLLILKNMYFTLLTEMYNHNFSLEDIVAQIDKFNLNLFVKVITITGIFVM